MIVMLLETNSYRRFCRCFFGAIFGYPAGYYLGRKYGMVIAAIVFVVRQLSVHNFSVWSTDVSLSLRSVLGCRQDLRKSLRGI